MADDIKQAQEGINRKIDDAYNRLEELENEEDHLSEELNELNTKRHRFHVLSELSDQLEKLEKLGGELPPAAQPKPSLSDRFALNSEIVPGVTRRMVTMAAAGLIDSASMACESQFTAVI